ncbi:MAG: flavodoxin family protein, partial [Spirochaetota bacterium]
MNIIVLHGSPKGETSVTMQYVLYLQKKMPEHSWNIECVASRISKLENDESAFSAIIEKVKKADIVLWSFPLYHLLVPSQMKRFIELTQERNEGDAFFGKYAAAIMTSIHYYDHTARNYIQAVSEDLGMSFAGAFTPAMDDLKKPAVQKNLLSFAEQIISERADKRVLPVSFPPLSNSNFKYHPAAVSEKISTDNLRVRIIFDGSVPSNAAAMAERLKASFDTAEYIDISSAKIKGGCLGCMRCGAHGICAYDGSDDYREIHQNMVMDADIIFFAGPIRDRYLTAQFKRFFDRSFYMNHQPVYTGKQIGWLISGPLGQIPNLRQIMEAYADVSRGNIAGIISDESGDSSFIDAQIDTLASRAVSFARNSYVAPSTFLGDGGRRLFRDEIW